MTIKKILGFCGAALAALFLCRSVMADSVLISTAVNNPSETAIIPTAMFGTKTIVLINPTTNFIYLTGFPEATTAQAVTDGFILYPSVSVASNTLNMTSFHGALYGVAPNAGGPVRINYLGGQ